MDFAGRALSNRRGRFFLTLATLLVVLIAGYAWTDDPAPTITTDRSDYSPGDTVVFEGQNWVPGETVTIDVSSTSGDAATLQPTADEAGAFTISYTLPGAPTAAPAIGGGGSNSAAASLLDPTPNPSGDYKAVAGGARSSATAETVFTVGSPVVQVPDLGEDPDLPAFMVGKVDKAGYMERRAEFNSRLRGVKPGVPFDPGARGRAIAEMNQQGGGSGNTGAIALRAPSSSPGPLASSSTVWTSIGPAPLSNGQTFSIVKAVSGRVSVIAIHPTNGNIAYVGAADGGVYRTLDGGNTWTAIFDGAQSLAIGTIAISPSQPSTIYVGTGEPNLGLDSLWGVGVYRIDNADGATPTLSGPLNKDASNNDVFTGRGITKIIVHPTNPDIIFVGSHNGLGGIGDDEIPNLDATRPRGLFRSTNATSANPTFTKLTITGVLNSGNRGITDFVFEPGTPNTLLVGVRGGGSAGNDGGVYRTTTALDPAPAFTKTLATGGTGVVPRLQLAINKVGSAVTVFVAIEDSGTTSAGQGIVKRSTDGGVTWSAALTNATNFCDGQCWYDEPIAVDPTNANILYLGGGADGTAPQGIFLKSTNALAATPTFTKMQSGLHADEHAIAVDPSNTSIVWTGNDGGIFKSTDGAATWTSLNNTGFNATQFQSIALHPSDPYFTIGGTQDNGTEWQKPDNTWTRADFGDGGFALIDKNAADTTNVTMYHTYYNQASTLIGYGYVTTTANAHDNGWAFNGTGGSVSCTNGGGFLCSETVNFYAPMTLGPGSPNTIYFGTDRLHRSTGPGNTNAVVSQAPIVSGVPISAIGISPQNDNVRIVGLNNGNVWRTTTGSSTLINVTGSIPAEYIGRAVIDPNNQDTAYVTLAGFLGTSTAHIYKTTNLSNATPTWTGLDGGQIPDIPVTAFAVDPADSAKLYAGTDIGVYRSLDGGTTWTPFSNGLPRVAVFDMAIQNSNRILRIATHGRGIWEISVGATGTLQGTVTDASTTNPISGATVTAGTNSTITNASGFYQLLNISTGTYSVTASAAGYSSSTVSGVTVNDSATTTQNFALTTAPTSGCFTDTSQADFQAGVANNVDLTISAGDVKLASGAAAIDQQQTNTSNAQGLSISTTLWSGNTFTAGVSGQLTRLDVSLFNTVNLAGGSVIAQIRTTSGGAPTSTVLGTATLTGATNGFQAFTGFVPTINLTAGVQYFYSLHTSSGSCAQNRRGNGATDYAGGNAYSSSNTGSTWGNQDPDCSFITYVSAGFATSGDLTSSFKDSNPVATQQWTNLTWTATTPAGTTVKFQAAGSNNSAGPFNFVGPDTTSGTFFTTSGASLSQFNGNRYLKYKAFLSTTNSTVTPTLSDATVCFNNVTLPATSLAASSASGTYGGTANLTATLTSSSSPVSGKTINFTLNGNSVGSAVTNGSGVATLVSASLAGINVATYASGVGASFAGDSGFQASSGSNSLTVSKAHLTVTANAQARGYGDANPAFTSTLSGFVNGETLGTSGVTGTAGATGAATTTTGTSAPGPYTITPTIGTLAATNYDFTPFVNGTLTISKAHLTVTANAQARGYGDVNPTFTSTLSGFKNGETLATSGVTGTAGATGTATTTTGTSAPGPYTITPTIGTLAATNYDFTPFVNGTLTISKAHLAVTADAQGRGYGDANPAFTSTLSGFKNGETLATSGVTGTAGATGTATTTTGTSAPGPYTITPTIGTLAATNYDFTPFVNGTLTISKAHLTVTADAQARGYGDANPAFTSTLSGFKNGQTLATSGVTGAAGATGTATTTTGTSSPGPYTITPTIGTLAATNYDFTPFVNGTLTIGRAHLTVTADAQARGYGDPNPPFTSTLSGFKNGETLATSGVTGAAGATGAATTTTGTTAPGPYTITPTIGTLAAANYDFTPFVNGTLTISKAHLTVTADAQARGYGDANPAFTSTLSGFKNGETLATSGVTGTSGATGAATTTTGSSAPGPYTITPTIGTLVATNYDFTPFVNGTLTISKAHLTVAADAQARAYGDPNPPFTSTLSGFKNGETLGTSGVTGTAGATGAATTTSGTSAPGPYTITPTIGSLAATNYDFTPFVNGTLTINKAHLTVTADAQARGYGDANPAFTSTLSGFKNGETLATSGVTGTAGATGAATTSTGTSAPGPYTITPTIGSLVATNYDFTPFVNGTLTISKAHLTVTADDNSRGYGDANPAFTATLSGFKNGETLATSGVTGSASCTSTAGPSSAVPGPYAITCTAGTLLAGNYDFAVFVAGDLTVTKAHLAVTANDNSRGYGDANPALTATLSGFKNGETLATSGVVGSASCSSTAGPTSSVPGPYPISCAQGTLVAGNYDFTVFIAGSLTVTKAQLTVTADDNSREYGDANPALTATLSGFKNGETLATSGVTGSASCTSTADPTSPAPGPYVIACTLDTLAAGNYDFASFVAGNLTVTTAQLTVTGDDKSRTYGYANPAFTATLSGFKNGETLATSGVTGSASCTSTAGPTSAVPGPYGITCTVGTLVAGNYDFTPFVDGNLTVTKAHLTVTADDNSRGYGDANPALTATLSGFQNGETLATSGVTGSASCTSTAGPTSAVPGPYPITCTLGALAAGNYDFTSFVNGSLTVTKAHLTVTGDDKGRTYGYANPPFTATLSGFKNGETLATSGVTGSASCTSAATPSSAVPGPYAITCTAGTLLAGNYDFTVFVAGNLTVRKAHLTVTADDNSRGYGDANPAFNATLSGFKNGETLATSGVTGSASCTSTAVPTSAVPGPYPISCTLGTLAAGNYDFTVFVAGNLTVTKAHLTVTADANSRGYGDANPALTATLSGFKNSETLATSGVTGSASCSSTAGPTSAVPGPYPITCTQGALAAGNYDFTSFVNGNLTVTKAHLTVTGDDKSRTYGYANPAFTATLSGFKNGETLATSGVTGSASCTSAATPSSAVPGPYAIPCTAGTLVAGNYDFTVFVAGNLTVTKAHLTVTADGTSREYGNANPAFTATLSGFKNGETLATSGVAGSASCTTTAGPTSAVPGPYSITCTIGTLAAGNYDFTVFVAGNLTVTKAHLTVTADNQGRLYGDPNPTFTATLSGFKNSETLATSGVTGSASCSSTAGPTSPVPGPYTITCTLGTLTAGNYDFPSFVTGNLTVNKAPLTVTANDKTRIYGTANPSFDAAYAGFKNGETLATSGVTGTPSLTTAATATSSVAGSPYAIVSALGTLASGNYSFGFVNGNLAITKATLTVTGNDKTRIYGYANPSFDATLSGYKNGETLATSGVTGSASCTSAATLSSPVPGPYAITCTVGTLLAGNYDFTPFVNGNLTVTKAHLTVTADNQGRLYGDPNPTFTATLSGFKNGETLGTSGVTGTAGATGPATTTTGTTAPGPYTISPTIGTLAAGNYDFTPFVNGTLTISTAHLTVTANNQTRLYGDANPVFTSTLTGFKNGEVLATSGVTGTAGAVGAATTTTGTTAPGPYTITPTIGTLAATNYDFTPFVNGTLTISKAHLTVTGDNKTRVYGDANPAFTATLTGFKNSETLATSGVTGAASCTSAATLTSAVPGPYAITCTVGTLLAADYDFTPFVNGNLTVTKAHLTVAADAKSRLYGGPDPAFTATLSGFKNGQTLATSGVTGAASCISTAVAASTVAGNPYTISCTQGSLAAGNYDFTPFVGATLTINRAPLTVTADPKSKQYSDPMPGLTATISGFVLGETDSGLRSGGALAGAASLSTTVTVSSVQGGYPITVAVGTLIASNYSFVTFVAGTLTVNLENAYLAYTGDTLDATAKATTSSTATVQLAALVTEAQDGSLGNTLAGKTVRFSVFRYNNNTTTADYTVTGTVSGTNSTATASISLTADNYTVKLELLPNNQYGADIEDATFTVVNPGTGMTAGGGWLTEPDGSRGNFGFTVKYVSGQSGNPQGNHLYINRAQMDLSAYGAPAGIRAYNVIFKSNALTALQTSPTTTPKTAKFTGKDNIKAIDRLTGLAYDITGGVNYQFEVDVTDNAEPSSQANPDKYALRVWTSTGNYKVIGVFNPTSGANEGQVALQGGNIQVK